MGFDSVEPWLGTRTRACSCCAAPPTPAARTLQAQRLVTGDLLSREHIARLAQGRGTARPARPGGGATFPAEIERVRELAPTLPLLIPGVGAQGGDAVATVRAGWRGQGGHTSAPVVVNSRAILYASRGNEFAAAARSAAQATRILAAGARPRVEPPLYRPDHGRLEALEAPAARSAVNPTVLPRPPPGRAPPRAALPVRHLCVFALTLCCWPATPCCRRPADRAAGRRDRADAGLRRQLALEQARGELTR